MNELINISAEPILRAEGVYKSYGPRRARTTVLHGVELNVAPGELTVLKGESGSGKTSLLLAMAGIAAVSAGSVYHRTPNGEVDLTQLSKRQLTKWRGRHAGVITQESRLGPDLTAWENIVGPSVLQGIEPDEEHVRGVCDELQLGRQTLGRYAYQLSGGEKQRVAIAAALARAPRAAEYAGDQESAFIVFADEPTAALDTENTEKVHKLLREVVVDGLGITTIMVSHDEAAEEYANRVVELKDGSIVADERISTTSF